MQSRKKNIRAEKAPKAETIQIFVEGSDRRLPSTTVNASTLDDYNQLNVDMIALNGP